MFITQSTLFVLLFLLVTAVLLVITTEQRQNDYVANQDSLMSAMTRSTANEISLLVKRYRQSVTLFAEDHSDLLMSIIEDPADEDMLDFLHTQIKKHFPNSFAITLAKPDGEVLLDDFDGEMGEVCIRDLQNFSHSRHPYEIFIHPHAEVYHFDMPVMAQKNGLDIAVFFVSFRLDEIARLLYNGSPPGHDLLLVKQKDPELIEVTGRGSRDVLGEHIRLTTERMARIGYQRAVAETNWTLLDIPDQGLFKLHRQELYQRTILIYVLVLLGSMFVLKRLWDAERIRMAAEARLKEKNAALTLSYEQLTQTQDKLVEAEKMASLGSLVAGVAHEINTPIGVAVTAISTVKTEAEGVERKLSAEQLKRSDFESFLAMVRQAGDITELNLSRASQLISSFKKVAVDQSSEQSRCFMLCDYVNEILLSLQPKLKHVPHRIKVICDEEIEINSFPGAISQIITNLVMNSLDHAFTDTQAGEMCLTIRSEEDSVSLDYTDNGCGISRDNLSKAFEPFYTTAREKGGSGLGLSIVYNLTLQLLGGKITLLDTNGNGLHINLKFPKAITLKQRQGD